jgi:hypothetical protein
MKVQVIQVPINSGFTSCHPKFPNEIRVSGISGSVSGISGSSFGLLVFCLALRLAAITSCPSLEHLPLEHLHQPILLTNTSLLTNLAENLIC